MGDNLGARIGTLKLLFNAGRFHCRWSVIVFFGISETDAYNIWCVHQGIRACPISSVLRRDLHPDHRLRVECGTS
jgi:hypothetical protein